MQYGARSLYGVWRDGAWSTFAHGELLLLAAYLNFPFLVLWEVIRSDGFPPDSCNVLIGYPLQRWIFNPLMHRGPSHLFWLPLAYHYFTERSVINLES